MVYEIPGLSKYGVDSSGIVYSLRTRGHVNHTAKTWKKLKTRVETNGYETITLQDDRGDCKRHSVHKLVALTFLGPCPANHDVHHKKSPKKLTITLQIWSTSYLLRIKVSMLLN